MKSNSNIKTLYEKVKSSRIAANDIEKHLEKIWADKMKFVWTNDSEVMDLRRRTKQERRRFNRLNRILTQKLEEHIGPIPSYGPRK